MELGVTNGTHRQHNRSDRPVSFAGIGLDEVDGATSFLSNGGRPTTGGAGATPAKGGRQWTFRDYGERIKELEGENFQLKVRLHLIDQSRYGKNRSVGAQQSQHNNSGQDGLTVATNEIVTEFQQMKKDNEALNLKLVTAENQRLRIEEEKEEILRREQDQISRNEELNHKLDVLDRELALVKLKKEDEEDEIEKCVKAFNSFGGSSTTHSNNNNLFNPTIEQNNILQDTNEKLESQLRTLKNDNEVLKHKFAELQTELKQNELEKEKLLQKARKHRDQIIKLKEENHGLNVKVASTCETMKEMGFQYNDIKIQNKNLLAENEMLKHTLSASAQTTAMVQQAEMEINHLKLENAALKEKLSISGKYQREYGKVITELKSLRAVCPVDETYERFVTLGLTRSVSHQEIREDPSPDLGIETDHEALAQQLGSRDSRLIGIGRPLPEFSASGSSKASLNGRQTDQNEVARLKRDNAQLASKLKLTKQTLDSTVAKLEKTAKEKEDFEKAICRQLHRTHNILEDAHQSIEDQDAQRFQTNPNQNGDATSSSQNNETNDYYSVGSFGNFL